MTVERSGYGNQKRLFIDTKVVSCSVNAENRAKTSREANLVFVSIRSYLPLSEVVVLTRVDQRLLKYGCQFLSARSSKNRKQLRRLPLYLPFCSIQYRRLQTSDSLVHPLEVGVADEKTVHG